MPQLKTPSPVFIQNFVRFYFNHRNDPQMIEQVLNGFTNQGLNMRMFYWVDPDLAPTKQDLREILKDKEYALNAIDIEKLVDSEPLPLPAFKEDNLHTYVPRRR